MFRARSCVVLLVSLRIAVVVHDTACGQDTSALEGSQTTDASNGDLFAAETDDRRNKVPTAEQQEVARKRVREVLDLDYNARRTPAQWQGLAEEFLKLASETRDMSAQYVLFDDAYQFAVKAGDLELAFTAKQKLAEQFRVDALKEQAVACEQLSRAGAPPEAVLGKIQELIDTAIERDQYDVAEELIDSGRSMALRMKVFPVVRELRKQQEDIPTLKKRYTAAVAARKSLDENPDNATAHYTVGLYYLLNRHDWESALTHLAKGREPRLRRVASLDLSEPTDATLKAEIGDQWWDLAEILENQGSTDSAALLRDRAVAWYRRALPSLQGIAKVEVEKRLSEPEKPSMGDPEDGEWRSLAAIKPAKIDADAKRESFATSATTTLAKHRLLHTTPPRVPMPEWVFMHPWINDKPAKVTYEFDRPISKFRCLAFVYKPSGDATFRVTADEKLQGEVTLSGNQPPRKVEIDLEDCKVLVLEVGPGSASGGSWAIWITPQVR